MCEYKIVALNDAGLRIGQYHQSAKLSNDDVALIRQLYESGMNYKDIAEKFEVSWHTVGRICRYERRVQTARRFKKIKVT